MTTSVNDKYDEAITYFNEHPEELYPAWNLPEDHLHGCLFERLGESPCGCPVQVNTGLYYAAETAELQAKIRAMNGLPHIDDMFKLTDATPDSLLMCRILASLPKFAEAQRLADQLLESRHEKK